MAVCQTRWLGRYLAGILRAMALLAKSDIHFSFERQAQQDFLEALRQALRQFETGMARTRRSSRRYILRWNEVVPQEEHRVMLFEHLTRIEPDEAQLLADAVNTKRVADLYLVVVASRLWPDFAKTAVDQRSATAFTSGWSVLTPLNVGRRQSFFENDPVARVRLERFAQGDTTSDAYSPILGVKRLFPEIEPMTAFDPQPNDQTAGLPAG